MRRIPALAAAAVSLVLLPSAARAHPGSGIVVDARGNVYFVVFGSHQLMKLSPDGRASVLTSDERLRVPHHLTLAPDGTLYVAPDDDGRVFAVSPDGRLRLHFNSGSVKGLPGFQAGAYGDPFTVDAAGNVFALAYPGASAVVRIAPAGTATPIAPSVRMGPLHFRSMTVDSGGTLYLTEEGGVWVIRGDSATFIRPTGVLLEEPTGIALDAAGNMYVADFRGRRVVRFSRNGTVNTPSRLASTRFRGPTGVAVRHDTVYVLDHATSSTAVWRVTPGRARRVYTTSLLGWYSGPLFASVPVLLVALLVMNRVQRRRRQVSGAA